MDLVVFLIELDFFYSLFFYHIVKKIILEKNHVIKLYEVIKIKICRGNHYSPNTYCTVDYNSNQQWFVFFFFFVFLGFWIFVLTFCSNLFLSILFFKIEIVENLAS